MRNLMFLIFFSASINIYSQTKIDGVDILPPDLPDLSGFKPTGFDQYYDINSAGQIFIEAWLMKNIENQHGKGHSEVLKMIPVLAAEVAAIAPLNRVNKQIYTISYTTLCNNFVGGALNRKQQLCIAKRDYIIEASRVVTELINKGTRFPVNNGIADQINQRYTEITNMLNYELAQMQLEKERRSVVERLLR